MDNKTKKEGFTPPDGGYGWIIVLSTTFMNICLLPIVQCFGIIYRNDFEALGITGAQKSFLMHLHIAIYCSLGLLGSPLLKKFNFRQVALMGTCIMCTGIFLSSFARSYTVLICTFSLLVGVGQGVLLPATYVATNSYFKKRLTLAISFSVTGASISSIFMPHVCTALLTHLNSTQNTVLVLAAISLVAIGCCFLLKPIRTQSTQKLTLVSLEINDKEEQKPEEIKMLHENIYKETTIAVKKETFLRRIYDLFDMQLLKNRSYVITIIGMSISFASEYNIIAMLPFILPELATFQKEDVALVLSIQSVGDIFGRMAVPLAGHYLNVPPKVMYVTSLITSTIGRTVIAFFYSSKTTICLCATLLGLAKGTKAVYQSVIIPKFVSLDKLAAANGLNMLLSGAASLIFGPLLGAIHDYTNSYVHVIHAGSLISMTCVILWIVHYFVWERNHETASEDE